MGFHMPDKVAVLVDGDNVSADHANFILKIGSGAGMPQAVLVYGDASRNSGWHGAAGYHFVHAGAGKNATDLLLSIDAMELALRDEMNCFVIASSDGDFSHLAIRLRERGAQVVGAGEAKTPAHFRTVCSTFHELAQGIKDRATKNPDSASSLDQKIRQIIARNSVNGRGIEIAELSRQMHRDHGTLISKQPEKTWRAYLLARETLYDLDPRGKNAMVRYKHEGFA
ncbi:NYN domain-containing protein [Seohaeicola saemankumensis]|nr:NYN domain-containing protein [Seohaeicola saemankumensis]MCA0872003.1 NYN domain-containing protein [Seohaeicola saemankumensis]